MSFLRSVQRLANSLERILKVCVVAALGGLALVVNLSVFYRYVLNAPLSWSTELARYLLIFAVLYAAAIALRHGLFVKVEIIYDLLPPRLRHGLWVTARLLIGAFLVVAVLSPEAMIQRAVLTQTISPALSIPMALVYRLMQAGFLTMLLFLVFGIVDAALQRRDGSGSAEQRP